MARVAVTGSEAAFWGRALLQGKPRKGAATWEPSLSSSTVEPLVCTRATTSGIRMHCGLLWQAGDSPNCMPQEDCCGTKELSSWCSTHPGTERGGAGEQPTQHELHLRHCL